MKTTSFFPGFSIRTAARAFALAAACSLSIGAAEAAPLFTLKGEAFDARYADQSEVRLSVLGWTAPDKLAELEAEYQRYTQNHDHAAFNGFLQQQETQGYLFTKAATGHSIKYAWQDEDSERPRMVLLVTPALKSRTPNLWKTPNNDPAPFSLIEVQVEGDQAVMKTSLETGIETDADGRLQLQDFEQTADFARLRDATPYYLKDAAAG
jgi:hypothetical protein